MSEAASKSQPTPAASSGSDIKSLTRFLNSSSNLRAAFEHLKAQLEQNRSVCADLVTSVKQRAAELDAVLSAATIKWRGNPGKPSVLVVDDEEDVVEIVESLLTAAGLDVTTARHGEEALSLYRTAKRPFDLVLTDLRMPRMDGRQLFEQLSRLTPQTPVVLMTGATSLGELETWLAEHGMPLLRKPFTAEMLVHTLRTLLKRTSATGPLPRPISA